MWARIVECMLGCWLLISPFIFNHPLEKTSWWVNDMSVGLTIIVLSLASYWRPLGWTHWLIVAVGAWLIFFGRIMQSPPLPGPLQNDILVGLLMMMFAIVPNYASQPPPLWRDASAIEPAAPP